MDKATLPFVNIITQSLWCSNLVHFVCAGFEYFQEFGIRFAVAGEQSGMLAVLFLGDQIGGVNQAAIVPANKFWTRKGVLKELSGPFGSLFNVVGYGTVGARHGVCDHRESRNRH